MTHDDFPFRSLRSPTGWSGELAGWVAAFNSTVVPGLAWVLTIALIVMIFMGLNVPDAFWGLVGSVVGLFLTARDSSKDRDRIEDLQQQLVALAEKLPPPPNPEGPGGCD